MGMINILAMGNQAATSADFVIQPGHVATLILRGEITTQISAAQVYIDVKDDDGEYWQYEVLSIHKRMLHIPYDGTYRIRRPAAGPDIGVICQTSSTGVTGGGGGGGGLTPQDLAAAGLLTKADFQAEGLLSADDLVNGRLPVDGSGVTQPVSVATLPALTISSAPLPTGSATSALQVVANTGLTDLNQKTALSNTELAAANEKLTAINNTNTALGTVNTNLTDVKTSLGTLATINTSIGTGNTSLTTIGTNTANTKTAVDTTNSRLTATNTTLGTINAGISGTNIGLGTINTSIGSTNTALGTVNTNLGTVNTSLGTINTTLNGPLKVVIADSNGTPTPAGSTTLSPSADAGTSLVPDATNVQAASKVLKASAGNLFGVNACTQATAGYLMIFDAASVPAAGVVTPKKCIPLGANQGLDISWNVPLRFTSGIVLAFSSTGPFTFTPSATAFLEGEWK